MKLDILLELEYNRQFLYIDTDAKVYRIADGVTCPNSPLVSHRLYNDEKYYTQIQPKDEILTKFKNQLITVDLHFHRCCDRYNTYLKIEDQLRDRDLQRIHNVK